LRSQNKRKIINDPVYGFINIQFDSVFDIIEHPFFQRLRRIKQLGLTHFVYPGAMHTRFQHAIGASHLMSRAINSLRLKGVEISEHEEESAILAVLMHDIGHGPFSHALEHSIVKNISHEQLSLLIMKRLNHEFDGMLDLAIRIYSGEYHKKFLNQLLVGQLDVDRLDYLRRDSFFTGVSEGAVGYERILKMLNVVDDELVVEAKGIYSIEKFLISRRFMYWQVYLHKTVLSAENLLMKTLQRAKELAQNGVELFATPPLHYFLYSNPGISEFNSGITSDNGDGPLDLFNLMDDNDIVTSIKYWVNHSDTILSTLSKSILNRQLFAIEIEREHFPADYISKLQSKAASQYKINMENVHYFVFADSITNYAYTISDPKIKILMSTGNLVDISTASDILNINILTSNVRKFFLMYPKTVDVDS
jgi:uncharacterized protein